MVGGRARLVARGAAGLHGTRQLHHVVGGLQHSIVSSSRQARLRRWARPTAMACDTIFMVLHEHVFFSPSVHSRVCTAVLGNFDLQKTATYVLELCVHRTFEITAV